MDYKEAMHLFREWDSRGKCVFTKHQLARLFYRDSPKTLTEGLGRLVKSGLLRRACRGVYVNEYAQSFDGYVIEHVAKALRPGEYSYVSLESMLSEYGAISQAPPDRLMVVTTGRKGVFQTPYGVIEFTHTRRSVSDILDHTIKVDGRPLRIATLEAAWRDLKRVGRNVNMVNREALGHG